MKTPEGRKGQTLCASIGGACALALTLAACSGSPPSAPEKPGPFAVLQQDTIATFASPGQPLVSMKEARGTEVELWCKDGPESIRVVAIGAAVFSDSVETFLHTDVAALKPTSNESSIQPLPSCAKSVIVYGPTLVPSVHNFAPHS